MRKIPEDVREAYAEAIKKIGAQDCYIDHEEFTRHLHSRAEEILNGPKSNRLVDKLWERLRKFPPHKVKGEASIFADMGYDEPTIALQKSNLAKALEGIVELPEKVTREMETDFVKLSEKYTWTGSLEMLFIDIRAGKYEAAPGEEGGPGKEEKQSSN